MEQPVWGFRTFAFKGDVDLCVHRATNWPAYFGAWRCNCRHHVLLLLLWIHVILVWRQRPRVLMPCFRTCKRNGGLLLDLPNPPFNTVTPSVNARADSRAILAVRGTQTKESPSENVWSKSHPPSTHHQQQRPPEGLLLNPSTPPPPSQPLHPTPPTIHPLQPLHTLREPWSLSAITSFSVA